MSKLFYHARQSATDARKITSKKVIPKSTEATGDLKKSQEVHCRIIQKQLQMNNIKKYLNKDIYQIT